MLEIPYSLLTKTFRDAIDFTRRLGFRYIWIDSLCIIQDDIYDWREESERMCQIFKHATLTIAATASGSGEDGCFRQSDSQYLGFNVGKEIQPHAPGDIYVRKVLPHGDFEEQPLLKRAWVYQERILSPRIINFASQELVWECFEGNKCECDFYQKSSTTRTPGHVYWYMPKLAHKRALDRGALLFLQLRWQSMVGLYTQLRLSVPADKLPAISGLAMELQPYRGKYLAGLWEDSFFEDLVWKTDGMGFRPKWRGPTWSWVSVTTKVGYLSWGHEATPENRAHPKIETHAKLLTAVCKTIDNRVTGEVKSAIIEVEGLVVSGIFRDPYNEGSRKQPPFEASDEIGYNGPRKSPRPCRAFFSKGDKECWFSPDYLFHGGDRYYNINEGEELTCLKVATYRIYDRTFSLFLVLREVGFPPRYERVGLIDQNDVNIAHGWMSDSLDSLFGKYGTLKSVAVI
jgi:hypothetical protein